MTTINILRDTAKSDKSKLRDLGFGFSNSRRVKRSSLTEEITLPENWSTSRMTEWPTGLNVINPEGEIVFRVLGRTFVATVDFVRPT